jgi:hypothetical protein
MAPISNRQLAPNATPLARSTTRPVISGERALVASVAQDGAAGKRLRLI